MAGQSTMPRAGTCGQDTRGLWEHGSHSMTTGTRTTFRELEMLIPLGEYFPENLEYSTHK